MRHVKDRPVTHAPLVDRRWALRYGIPSEVRERLRQIEGLAREADARVRERLRDLPGDPVLVELVNALARFIGDGERGALGAALRREVSELQQGAPGRRILETAWTTVERTVGRVLEADDMRRELVSRVAKLRARFDGTIAWHLTHVLAEWKLDTLHRVSTTAAMRRGKAALGILERSFEHRSQEVSRVTVRILEQSGWPRGVASAELLHAASLVGEDIADQSGVRRRGQLRAASAAHAKALLGAAGSAVLERSAEHMADELLRQIDTAFASSLADIDAAAILLRGAARARSAGRVVDPVPPASPHRSTDGIGIAPLFGTYVLVKRGLVSPVQLQGNRASCGALVDCVVAPQPGVAISRPIDEWGTPLFDHPRVTASDRVATARPARVRVFARIDGSAWLAELVERGELRLTPPDQPESEQSVMLLSARRDLRPTSSFVTHPVGASPDELCGMRRETVLLPVHDLPRAIRQSALSGAAVDVLESEWQFLAEAQRRTRVTLPRPVGTDAVTEALLYEVPEGLSLGHSASLRQLRERDPLQIAVAVAGLWRALHEDYLLQRRPNSLALGVYHEQTVRFRPSIGVGRDGILAVVTAAPCAAFTGMPYPHVPETAAGLPRFSRLGGPPLTRWLARWGLATPGRDAFAAILFMLEILAARKLQLESELTWSEFVAVLAERAQSQDWFQDPEKATELVGALRMSETHVVQFLAQLSRST
jgi:hypothetical protein